MTQNERVFEIIEILEFMTVLLLTWDITDLERTNMQPERTGSTQTPESQLKAGGTVRIGSIIRKYLNLPLFQA